MMNQSRTSDTTWLHYEPSNRSCEKRDYLVIAEAPLCVLFVSIIIVTVCGNLLVIITISHFKQLHTPTNYLVLSLAVADFLVGAVVMPPSMVQSLEICWNLRNLFCKLHTGTEIMLCNMSILNLSLISVDRYYAVRHPLRYQSKITNCATVTTILSCWGFSAVLGYGVIFLKQNTRGTEDIFKESLNCKRTCPVLERRLSSIAFSVVGFFIPGFLITVLCLKILLIARRQACSLQNRVSVHADLEKSKTTVKKTEPKATKTLGIVVGVYLACWTPWFLCNLTDPTAVFSSPVLMDVLTWLGYLNSGINPIIYAFSFTWFRKPFKRIIQKKP